MPSQFNGWAPGAVRRWVRGFNLWHSSDLLSGLTSTRAADTRLPGRARFARCHLPVYSARRVLGSRFCLLGVLVLGWSIVGLTASLSPIDTFEADLVRQTSTGRKEETLRGRVYYSVSSGRLLIKVVAPVHQWVLVQGKEMYLYYPEVKQAFRVLTRAEAAMPFFRVIWNCFTEDFDFAKQGYKLARYDRKGSTLVSTWTPPGTLSRFLGEATLEYDGKKLLRVEHLTARRNLLSRVQFSQHVPVSGYLFPLEVSITYGSPSGTSTERVSYTNPRFNQPLAPEAANFRIPAGIEVKDIVW